MGQGLGMIGLLEPSSDANSTSFYSNNTSANLNNSRYLYRRDGKMSGIPGQVNSVEKVMPNIMKSIDNNHVAYGSHTSNFTNAGDQMPLNVNNIK